MKNEEEQGRGESERRIGGRVEAPIVSPDGLAVGHGPIESATFRAPNMSTTMAEFARPSEW